MDSRTYRMISDVLRTVPLTESTRDALVDAFTSRMDNVPAFDSGKFRHESTRGRRSGELPTITLDERLPILPDHFRDYLAAFDMDDDQWQAVERMTDATLARLLTDEIGEHGAMLHHARDEVRANAAHRVLQHAEEVAARRDRTPGAWVLPTGETPIGPFPDEDERTGTEIAMEYALRNGIADFRVVFRKG